jgi:hypothetical protein
MHKNAKPPLINSTQNYDSIQIDGLFKGGSPALSWNDKYNNGDVLDASGFVVTTANNIIIDYYKQPFNYIEIGSSSSNTNVVQINNCPPMWWYVYNTSATVDIIISPQINGVESPEATLSIFGTGAPFDPTNNYVIPANSYNLVAIVPGNPPLVTSLRNPTTLTLV